jgi:poly(3-hydroxybutyrate) depolymerase
VFCFATRRFGSARLTRHQKSLAAYTGLTVLSATLLVTASPVEAASAPVDLPPPTAALTEVTNFGPNPTRLQMFTYVPSKVRPHPAVVVAVHYCTGSGPAMFNGTQFAGHGGDRRRQQ